MESQDPVPRSPFGRSSTVLVADDDLVVREAIQEILELDGYRVLVAGDGQQALRVLSEETIDVLILDIKMPHVDGWTVLRTISGARPQVIIHSAQDFSPRDIRGFFEVRPFDILPKPVRPSRMLAVVEEAVDRLSVAEGRSGEQG